MRQAMHRPFNRTQVISFGFLTVLLSLLQPIPPVSAEQHSTKFVEKKDAQTLTRTPHRLIRKQPNAPVASVEPSPSGSSSVSPLQTVPPTLQSDNTAPQSTEPSSLHRSVGAAVPLAAISVAPSPTTAKGSIAVGTSATGTIPLAAAGAGNSSTSGNGNAGGRSMSKLAAEMPGLAQLISPPSGTVVSTNPAIGPSPVSLSFTAQVGTNPTAQTLSISNTGAGTLTWMASGNAAWLTLSPASGTGNGAVTLSVTTGTMTPGTYSSAVNLTATGATPVTIPVSFTVTAPPSIGANPTSLSFTAQQGGANPATQTVSLSNTGGSTLSWTASDNATWLTVSPASGTGTGTVTVSATGTQTTGTQSGSLTLSATGATSVTIPVSFTVTAAPTIGANPTSLSFTAQQGGANPAVQTVSLSNTGGGTLNWSATETTPWLTVSPASGTGTGTVTVSVTTGSLTAGPQPAGSVTFSAPGATSVTIPVSFTVTAAPAISASPTSLSFTAQQGGANPAVQTVSLSNTAGGSLSWSASETTPWLTVSPASGTGNGTVTVSVTTGSLTAGPQPGGSVTFSAPGATSVTIPVSFTVTAALAPPAIGASPTSLSFTAQQGGANPATQTVSLSNTGGGTLSWTASDNATWLTVSPASGTGTGTVTVSATGTQTTGTQSGSLTLSATGATSVTIPVSFTVTAAPSIGANPTSLSFTAQQGGANPATQTVSLSNTGGGTLSWTASDNATWLTVSPASGTGTGTVTVSATGTQTTGTQSGSLTLSATGATSVTIPVSFTVTAAPTIGANPTSLSFTAQQGGANPAVQTVSLSNTGGGTLSWTASDNATWLTVSPASGTGNGTVTVSATGTQTTGTQSGSLTLSAPGATSVTIPVSFTVTAAPVTPTIGLSSTAFTFAATQGAANPTSQTLNITNPGTGTLTWSIAENANWLTLAPTSGTTTTGTSPATLSVNTAGLLPGSFTTTMTVTGTGATNTPQTIPVTLTLNAPATSSATLSWNANTDTDLASYSIYISTTPGVYGAAAATVQKPTTTYVATGLNIGNTYYFTVTAVDSAGNESAHSNEVSKDIL